AGKFGSETEYGFRHALVRDAAYAMLTEADRILGHELAARWLQRMGGSDPIVLDEVAEHEERVASALRDRGDTDPAATHFAAAGLARARIGRVEAGIRGLLAALETCDPERRAPSELAGWIAALAAAAIVVRAAPRIASAAAPALRRIAAIGTEEEGVGSHL